MATRWFLTYSITAILITAVVCLFPVKEARSSQDEAADIVEEAQLTRSIRLELMKKYPDASEIQVSAPNRLSDELTELKILQETGKGELVYLAKTKLLKTLQGRASYSVWAPVKITTKRIQPLDKIMASDLQDQRVNLAQGAAFEFRGAIFPASAMLERGGKAVFEARHTILEGQTLLISAVIKVPDVRRGESVKVRLNSGALSLTTTGSALENGTESSRLRVSLPKSNREVTGVLTEKGLVEVEL